MEKYTIKKILNEKNILKNKDKIFGKFVETFGENNDDFLALLIIYYFSGTVRDNRKAGVLEPTLSKVKSLKFATEAAITILRIDDMIKLDAEQKGGKNYQQAMESGELYE